MATFTVTLPKHNFTIPFNYDEFTQLFPNSLITLALQSGESNIELENKLVTPDILEVLSYITINRDYPYVGNPNGKRALDYLGIDLPDFVYEPIYAEFKKHNPNIRLLTAEDLNTNYNQILNSAIEEKFPSLVTYLFSQTNPMEHKQEDLYAFQGILLGLYSKIHSSNQELIAEMILLNRNIDSLLSPDTINNNIHDAFRLGYINLLQLMFRKFNRTPEAYTLNVNRLIQSMGNDPEHLRAYVDALNLLVPYIKQERYPGAYNAYQMFYAVYTGDVKSVERLLESQGVSDSDIAGYIWTAILTNHPDIIPLFFNIEEEEEPLNFLNEYVNHPSLITPDMLRLIGNLSTLPERRVAIRKLRQLGYPQLARILSQL